MTVWERIARNESCWALVLCAVATLHGVAAEVKMFAGARFNTAAWAKLQRFDVKALSTGRALEANVGRLVEVHFEFRSKDVRHLKPNWYQSALWQRAPEGRRAFVSVPVMIAAGDVNAFKAMPADPGATADLKVYGKVLEDRSNNYLFVHVLGTATVVDSDGYTNVTW